MLLPVAKKAGIPSSKIYILGGKAKGRKSFAELIDDSITRRIPDVSPRPVKKDTLAYLVFSSGTSGLPKGLSLALDPYYGKLTSTFSSCYDFPWKYHIIHFTVCDRWTGNS